MKVGIPGTNGASADLRDEVRARRTFSTLVGIVGNVSERVARARARAREKFPLRASDEDATVHLSLGEVADCCHPLPSTSPSPRG